ncbi:MAG TPA: helix-turn-helix transcriptional regulator [Candidatus Limnocylindrales bacterium]|nr:helix-turn-helix transcriptional regulator [Candidatus Limnocylindrales bacterium]
MGARTKAQLDADRRTVETRRAIGAELRRNREDQGLPQRSVAGGAGIDRGHLSRIEAWKVEASLGTLSRVSAALGGELSARFYPGTGSRIRDHIQAAILEALLGELHPRWKRFVEVPVYRPVMGVIDLVLHDPVAGHVVAVEIQSELRRLEQIVRWSHQKRDALPSAAVWRFAASEAEPADSSLLVVRSTRATRAVTGDHNELIRSLFPARASEIHAALTTEAPWPGAGLLWAAVERGKARLMSKPPWGLSLGR